MFLIRFFRFLSGYVIFSGKGGFPERFINLCAGNGIALWDAKASDGAFQAKTNISGYKRIRTCAKKSGMRIRMTKKCGLPFLVAPYLRRKGLFAGAVLSVICIILLTSTVWTVEVIGNEKFTKQQIIDIAKDYGVYTGAFKRNINLKNIRSDIKAQVDGISWFSVNIDGSHITLQVSETSGSTEILDVSKPCNIISEVDGEILRIDTKTGTPAALPGSAVTKGDLLISGVMEKTDGSPFFVHARGSAVIRTNCKYTVEIPMTIKSEKPDTIKKRYGISIFGLEIPLGSASGLEHIRKSTAMLQFKDKTLPIGIFTNSYIVKSKKEITLSPVQTALFASFTSFCNEKEIMKNAVPESKTVSTQTGNSNVTMASDHLIHKTTGLEHYFEVDKQNY